SCRTRCGEDYYRGHACHCDYNCLLHKECCPDYEGLCTTANSCKGRCGEDFQRGRKCDCDAGCLEFNQCCSDYQSHCLKATKKLAVNLSPLIQKPIPTTQSSASSRFQAIETATSDSNSANEEIIQDLSESQLITLSTLPPVNQPTSRPAVTTMQLENLKYPEFQRDDETVLLELTEAMPYQEQFLPSFTHSFSTEPSAPSSVFSILQSTTEASTKPEEHANPTEPLVLESDTIRPAVTEQTTPSAAVNDQEPETLSESDTTRPAVTEQTTTPSAAVNDQESETPSESDTTRPAVTEQTTTPSAAEDQEPETTPSESDTTRPAVTEQTTPSAAVNDQEPETPSESDTIRPAVTEQTTTPSAAVNDQESETPSESDTTGPAVTEQTTTPSAEVNDQEPETPSESDTIRPAVTEKTTTPSAAGNDQESETPSESDTTGPAVTEKTTPSAAVNDQEPETPSESDTIRPAVTEQTTTPSAVNDQEPDTPSESGFEPSMTDAPETDTPSPPEGDVPSASPTQTPASTSTLSLTITTPTNNPSDIFLPEFMTTVSNQEDSASLPPYSTESSTPLIAFFTPQSTTGASEKPEEKANPTEPQASESNTTRPDISALASIAATDNVEELSMTELQTPRGALATPPGAENIPEPAVPTGHWFWMLNSYGIEVGYPRRITDVWGIPSPIDSVFTRCNCQGKTFFFKGSNYWRFENGGMDPGYPKLISKGFGGIKGQITAALSVSSSWRRPESVYFFKQGCGLVQKYSYTQKPPQTCKKMQTQYSVYSIRNRFARQLSSQSKDTVTLGQEINIKLQWRGFPTSVTSAISVPNARKPDGYDYFVFSRTRYYNINILADKPTVTSPSPSSERQRSTAKDWFKCP
ncbi:UNVERIFIED_CONTAM: hypothetical protein FKN15_065538, partial [Acipenser sinensis]